jgi:hypothetical protein
MPGQQVFHTQEEYVKIWEKRQAVFQPWVVETWRRHCEAIGAGPIAEKWRQALRDPAGVRRRVAGIKPKTP